LSVPDSGASPSAIGWMSSNVGRVAGSSGRDSLTGPSELPLDELPLDEVPSDGPEPDEPAPCGCPSSSSPPHAANSPEPNPAAAAP
jgi:hypothetical protein